MVFKCKDCPDRAASCHVACEKYAESLKEHEKVKKKEREENFKDMVSFESYDRAHSDKYQISKARNGYSPRKYSRKGRKI